MKKMMILNITRLRVINRYYRISRFYEFLKAVSIKTGLLLGLIFVIYFVLNALIPNAGELFTTLTSKISSFFVFALFFTSEFFLGFIPPEFFIAWTTKTINPWFHVFLFSSLSYLVGFLSYYLGKNLHKVKSIKVYLEQKASKHIYNLKRWGGFFIFVGAMLPIPYSIVCLTSGLTNYHIKHYLFWSLFRYVRFFIYAVIVYGII